MELEVKSSSSKLVYEELKNTNYRDLQKISKSLELPSNLKKYAIIELILTKLYKTNKELDDLIRKFKFERTLSSQKRKSARQRKRLEVTKEALSSNEAIASTSYKSPSITITPKNVGKTCRNNTERNKTNARRTLIQNLNSKLPPSDRVLRSVSNKIAKPNYAFLNGDDKKMNETETKLELVEKGKFRRFNIGGKHLVKSNMIEKVKNSVVKKKFELTQCSDILRPLQPESVLLPTLLIIPRKMQFSKTVCTVKQDGKVAQIDGYLQETKVLRPKNSFHNSRVNIQEITDVNEMNSENDITQAEFTNCLQIDYPNMASASPVANYGNIAQQNINIDNVTVNGKESNYIKLESPALVIKPKNKYLNLQNTSKCNQTATNAYSIYYHQKERSELRAAGLIPNVLPKFTVAFSNNDYVQRLNLTKPLYVQVSTEEELSQIPHFYRQTSSMIETIYNFKNNIVENTPLLQIATTSNVNCVNSITTVVTTKAQPSTVMCNEACIPSVTEIGEHDVDPHLYDFLQFSEEMKNTFNKAEDIDDVILEELPQASNLNECSLGINEMLEDVVELYPDGSYRRKRVSMVLNVECILCNWAGPKIGLENHIREMHPNEIIKMDINSCNMTYTLGSLYSRWLVRVLHHELGLYVLSAAVDESSASCLCVNIKSLSPQTNRKVCFITSYNKVTGQPFTWQGPILPYTPEDNNADGLKVELSSLDLFPNSANLKFMNRELVSDTPSKAIVGQSMLNDVHVIVFVAIY